MDSADPRRPPRLRDDPEWVYIVTLALEKYETRHEAVGAAAIHRRQWQDRPKVAESFDVIPAEDDSAIARTVDVLNVDLPGILTDPEAPWNP